MAHEPVTLSHQADAWTVSISGETSQVSRVTPRLSLQRRQCCVLIDRCHGSEALKANRIDAPVSIQAVTETGAQRGCGSHGVDWLHGCM